MKWLPRTKYVELIAKLSTKSPAELDTICDQFAAGATYNGCNVYVGELRSRLRAQGLLPDNNEQLDCSNDIEL